MQAYCTHYGKRTSSSLSRQNIPAFPRVLQHLSQIWQSMRRARDCSSCLPSRCEATIAPDARSPQRVVLPAGVPRGFSAPCLFHRPRSCRSACQNDAIDWNWIVTEAKPHNHHFGYSITLNIAAFSGIHTLQKKYEYFYCNKSCHFSLDWCSGDQSNFQGTCKYVSSSLIFLTSQFFKKGKNS